MTPRKLPCEVSELIDHGEGVYSVVLRPAEPAPRFLPGQFLHLALDPYSPGDFWPDSRVFSIASSPSDRGMLRITYAVKGRFTTRMESELRPGCTVWVKLPYGEFVINGKRDVVLFAGGTGISAFTAYLASLSSSADRSVTLFYGARNCDLLVYRDLADRAKQTCTHFRVFYFCEEQLPNSTASITCAPGRLSLSATWQLIPNTAESDYYLSGPPGMIQTITNELLDRKLDNQAIHIDAW